MQIARVTPDELTDFLALVNAEIRPDHAKTNAWDDFPLVLAPENRDWMLAIRDEAGRLVAGMAALIRDFRTTCGVLPIAGIGSVVTREEYRGRGWSSALQNEMLALLRGKDVPLAVLWTDQPEIYAGRGFAPAGWEVHVDFTEADLTTDADTRGRVREYRPGDTEAVQILFEGHELGTVRQPGDSAKLYGMPGTRGPVLADAGDRPEAAVFCGKGADFPGYVAEWSGTIEGVTPLLERAREGGLATHLLAPAGAEGIVNPLVDRDASWFAQASGYWAVLRPDILQERIAGVFAVPAEEEFDPETWLGRVDDDGDILDGPLGVAVWGLDSA